MKLKTAKILAILGYSWSFIAQGIFCFFVLSGMFDGADPSSKPGGMQYQLLLGLPAACFSIYFFFVFSNEESIKKNINKTIQGLPVPEMAIVEDIARKNIVSNWLASWGVVCFVVVPAMLDVLTQGLSHERFLISYGIGLVLMLAMYPRMERLKNPIGQISLTTNTIDKEEKASA